MADPGFSPGGGAPTPKSAIIFQFFAENCMKMKEFGPPGGARVPGAPLGSANGGVGWCHAIFGQFSDKKDPYEMKTILPRREVWARGGGEGAKICQ